MTTRWSFDSAAITINGHKFTGKASFRGGAKKPWPDVGTAWRFDRKQIGIVKRILPGGSGDLGICEFEGLVPAAHIATMLQFAAWEPCERPQALRPPCTCVTLDGGIVLADGCAEHDASKAKDAGTMPALEM